MKQFFMLFLAICFIPSMAFCADISLMPYPQAFCVDISLMWDPHPPEQGVMGYRIHVGTTSRGYTEIIDVGNIAIYTVTHLMESTEYFFAATAYDTAGNESGYSNEVFGTTLDLTVPSAPVGLWCIPVVFAGPVIISWEPVQESDVAGYIIYIGGKSGVYKIAWDVGNQTVVKSDQLSTARSYYIVVIAYDLSGSKSKYSNEIIYKAKK